jgi:uncharacterized repeat protein (TIGR02543 family)
MGSNATIESYPVQLQTMINKSLKGQSFFVENFGVSGVELISNSQYPLSCMPTKQAALEFKPDIVVLMLGSNDTWNETDAFVSAHFEDELRTLLRQFRDANPNVHIFLCTTPLRNPADSYTAQTNDRTETYIHPIQMLLAAELDYVTLVPIHEVLTEEILANSAYMSDNTHPRYAGYRLIAKKVFATMFPAVTFQFGDGKTLPLKTYVLNGKPISQPELPAREGLEFAGWYTDENCGDGSAFDPATPVTENITLYAKWAVPAPEPEPEPTRDPVPVPVLPILLGAAAAAAAVAGTIALLKKKRR